MCVCVCVCVCVLCGMLHYPGPEQASFGWSGQGGRACKARSHAQRECRGVRVWFAEVASGLI